jgi:AraC family transcriptional activator of pyochelin receptor
MKRDEYQFEITAFRKALRDGGEIPGDRFRQPDFQRIRSESFALIDEGTSAWTLQSRSVRDFVPRIVPGNYVYFAFAKGARDVRLGGGAWRRITGNSVNISAHASSSIDILRPSAHVTSTASVFVDRDCLVDCYGLNVDSLPARCQNVFRGRPDARFMFNVMLSSRSWLALDAIFRCKMADPLKSIYLKAKYQELLLETIDMLNRCDRTQLAKITSKAARERQLIEAAALMFRRDLDNVPSVAELALRLGVDRRRLIDGFRDIFGVGPVDYANLVRLDWAKEQLSAGVFSIEEAACAIGYRSSAAFAKAYLDCFGKPLSNEFDFTVPPRLN